MKKKLRILDLGSHDGFVSFWLGKQMKERDVEIEICGLELHPGAVEIAERRATEAGLQHDYRVGLAEDALGHWEPTSFDAVLAFEIIEHVPDVDAFLSTCEVMCKSPGRIYVSTPNGCFGSGSNPHHLRVYRDIDLFNTLRERGTIIHDMHRGQDGVTVTSYSVDHVAGSRGKAAIYAGPGWETWHPRDIEAKGLGGSETAAAMVAQALSDLGYVVTIYGDVEEGMWQQVELRHHSIFDPMESRELVIVSRIPEMFDRRINAYRKVLWMHDTDYGNRLTEDRAENADNIFVLSDWHERHIRKTYPFVNESMKVLKTINGINPAFFPYEHIPCDRPHRAIYSSSPDRGLDFLLELWPKVRKEIPDAELVYCYADVYNRVADRNPSIASFRSKIADLAEQEGVLNLGALSQDALASAMAMCRLWLAPSWSTPSASAFNETFCIGAVEAAAAGCHRVMSDWGALTERAAIGEFTLIPKLNEDAWVESIVRNMRNEDRLYHQDPAAMSYTWDVTARDLAGI